MPSYMTLVVLGLAASNVSPALSAPVRRAREQSLSYRAAATEAAEAGEKAWGPTIKKYGKQFLIGTGATMAFAYAFEKLNAKEAGEATEASSIPSTTSATPDSSNTATTANTANNQAYPGPSNPNYSTYPDPNYLTSPEPNYSASPEPGYSTSPNPTSQTQNGYQQRAVDRDLPADIFEARSTSDRQAASLDLLGRADLVETIRLFSRMLDELD